MSWWVGLSRAALDAQIKLREEQWKRKTIGMLDSIGERCRENWEPRREPRHPRGPV